MELIIFFFGIFGLLCGTDLLIKGATYLGVRVGLSDFFIGVVILSIGTDLPEIAVALEVGLLNRSGVDASDIVIGSSIGSALSQIGLVVTLLGLAGYITIRRLSLYRDGIVLIGSIFLVALMGWDGEITRLEGVAMMATYALYIFLIFKQERNHKTAKSDSNVANPVRNLIALIVGIPIVLYSSELTVDAAMNLANQWNMSSALISFLLIGVGTSLPELSISLIALSKKKNGMSIGNLIGSNILDILLPIGLSATIYNVSLARKVIVFDLFMLLILSALVLIALARGRGIQRFEVLIIMATYLIYVLLKIAQ